MKQRRGKKKKKELTPMTSFCLKSILIYTITLIVMKAIITNREKHYRHLMVENLKLACSCGSSQLVLWSH